MHKMYSPGQEIFYSEVECDKDNVIFSSQIAEAINLYFTVYDQFLYKDSGNNIIILETFVSFCVFSHHG